MTPEMLIADELTNAIDVSYGSGANFGLAQTTAKGMGHFDLLITHDMGGAAEMEDRIAVMYAGTIVEEGMVERIFDEPRHPYTIGLLQSILGFEGERSGLYDPRNHNRASPNCRQAAVFTRVVRMRSTNAEKRNPSLRYLHGLLWRMKLYRRWMCPYSLRY